MKIYNNFSLINHNSFGIEAIAEKFASISTVQELKKIIISNRNEEKIFIGGGSNILITRNIKGLVINLNMKGISSKKIDDNHTEVKINSGENWNDCVKWCLKNNLGGIENLSLIPGNTGAAPIQNIGAYGVELKDVFISCSVLDINTNKILEFKNEECQFEYRNSIFKQNKNYIVLSIKLKLTNSKHILKIDYGSIQERLLQLKIKDPNISDVAKIICQIRSEKLPDPKEIGNSGSFFKNPIISNLKLKKIKEKYPEIINYTQSKTHSKIAAGWLIEMAGWKGYRKDDFGVYDKQALVLVNYGKASGNEIIELSKKIQQSVLDKFDIMINPEVNII